MNKYIIFCDIDGTLVDVGGRSMSESIIAEINRLKSHGHIPVIVTGRPFSQLEDLGGIENFDYIASLFGNVIIEPNEKIKVIGHSLDINSTKKLVKIIKENNRSWHYKDARRSKCLINDKATIENTKQHLSASKSLNKIW